MRSAPLLATLLLAAPAFAQSLQGWVVGVADGDTITILDANKVQHKIRLAGIDAPEKAQPFGNVSRQHLAQLVFQKTVNLDCGKRDRYNREVCVVYLAGKDINVEQVRAGLAWWYRAYAKEQTAEQRRAYEQAEQEARDTRRGLWRDAAPTPPWDWRREKKRTD
ncbi:MAG TPA: thermonuclease family protein [Noviherbaspirillum sp.]|nr:thermonuclease family protein [Noviherbaspirillum sp.]